ncbi:hypothetical protein B0H65DRAFT_436823, partial [Neurospora tetraspora]
IVIHIRPPAGRAAAYIVIAADYSSDALEPSPVQHPLFVDPAIACRTVGGVSAKVVFHVGVAHGE